MAREMAKKPRYIYAEFATFLLVLMCLGSLNVCEGNFTFQIFILITMQRRRSFFIRIKYENNVFTLPRRA